MQTVEKPSGEVAETSIACSSTTLIVVQVLAGLFTARAWVGAGAAQERQDNRISTPNIHTAVRTFTAQLSHDRLIVALSRAGPAQDFGASPNLATEVDAFTTLFADYALAFESGKLLGR